MTLGTEFPRGSLSVGYKRSVGIDFLRPKVLIDTVVVSTRESAEKQPGEYRAAVFPSIPRLKASAYLELELTGLYAAPYENKEEKREAAVIDL